MATPQMLTASTGPQDSSNGNSAFLFQLLQQLMGSQMGQPQQQLDPNIAAIMAGNSDVAKQAIHANDPGRGRLRQAESSSNIGKPGTPGLDNLYAMNPYSVRGQVDWDGSLTANRAQAAGKLRDSNSALLQGQTNLEQAKVDALMRLLGQGGTPNAQGGVNMSQQQGQSQMVMSDFNPPNEQGVPFALQAPPVKSRMAGPGDMPFTNINYEDVDAIGAPWPPQGQSPQQQVPMQDIPGMQDWSNMNPQQVPVQDIPQISGLPGAPFDKPNNVPNVNHGGFAGVLPGMLNLAGDARKLGPVGMGQVLTGQTSMNLPFSRKQINLAPARDKMLGGIKQFWFGQ